MAGGIWTSQNKVRPGVYIRFQSTGSAALTVSERGVVAICQAMDWGAEDEIVALEAGQDPAVATGYRLTHSSNRFLQEIWKGSNRTAAPCRVLLYRASGTGGVAAVGGDETFTVTARYPGMRGNDLSVVVETDEKNGFVVSTLLEQEVVVQQMAASLEELEDNDWVLFSGSGALKETAGLTLSGGKNGTVNATAWESFLEKLEPHPFDILIYDGTDSEVKTAMVSFIQRMAEEHGRYAQLVASGLTRPDSPYVIHVGNGVRLSDGTILTPEQATWWVGGAQAGASYYQSLTYAAYPDAVSAVPMLTHRQTVEALKEGKLVFCTEDGVAKVEQDINSLVTITPDQGAMFSKNRVMRLCSTIANDIYQEFSNHFLGAVNNNAQGRNLLKGAIVGYLLDIQANQGIQNFTADDVSVLPGSDLDAVVIELALQCVDAAEKIYLSVSLS